MSLMADSARRPDDFRLAGLISCAVTDDWCADEPDERQDWEGESSVSDQDTNASEEPIGPMPEDLGQSADEETADEYTASLRAEQQLMDAITPQSESTSHDNLQQDVPGSHHPSVSFSDDELRLQAQGNGTAFSLALLRYARDHGETPDAAARWLGTLFAPNWESLQGQGAQAIARAAALNVVSLGGTLHNLTGDEQQAEVTLTDAVDAAYLEAFGLTRAEADALYTVFEPIADALSYALQWERTGETITLIFRQRE